MVQEFANSLPIRSWGRMGTLLTIILLSVVVSCSPAGDESSGSARGEAGSAGAAPEVGPTPAPTSTRPVVTDQRPDDWPSSRADLLNTGISGSKTDAREGRSVWEWRAEDSITQTPVAADGVVYVGDWSPAFYAVELSTGRQLWRSRPRRIKNANRELAGEGDNLIEIASAKEADDRYDHSSPAIFEDLVLACSQYGMLSAYRRADGEVVWERDIGEMVHSSLRVSHGLVVFGDARGIFQGLDARTGEPRFEVQTGDLIGSTCALLSDGTAIFPGHDRRLHFVDIQLGRETRSYSIGHRSTSTPLVAFGCVYFLHSGLELVAIDLTDGSTRWSQPGTEVTAHGLARAGSLVLVHLSTVLRAFDGATGLVAWQLKLKGSGAISPAVGPELVYIVDGAGWAHAIDPRDGSEVWAQHFAEEAVASPILVGGRLVCADKKGRLIAYE